MNIDKTSPLYKDLRGLSSNYGTALIVELINYIILGYVIFAVINMLCVASGIDMYSGSGAGYLMLMLSNDIASYLFPAVIFWAIFRKDIESTDMMLRLAGEDMRYSRFTGETVLLLLAGLFMGSAGSLATGYISSFLNDLFSVPEPQTAFSDSMPLGLFEFITFEVSSSVIAPICEEFIYRHLLLKPLRRYSDIAAATISALFFGISHYNFDQFLYTFFFGFALAIIAIRANSIIPSIICHMANNIIAGMTVYMPDSFGNDVFDAVSGAVSTFCNVLSHLMFWAGIPALILAIVLKLHKLKSASYVPAKTQFAVILSHPFTVIGITGSLLLTFLLLYV